MFEFLEKILRNFGENFWRNSPIKFLENFLKAFLKQSGDVFLKNSLYHLDELIDLKIPRKKTFKKFLKKFIGNAGYNF